MSDLELVIFSWCGQHGAARKDAGIPVCVASQGSLQKTRMTLDLTGRAPCSRQRVVLRATGAARQATSRPVPACRCDDGREALAMILNTQVELTEMLKCGEMGWTLEVDEPMNRALEA
jgi:hypothetical protein